MIPRAPVAAWAAWAVALLWSAALLAFAYAPSYLVARSGRHGIVRDTAALVDENGSWALVFALPLVITLLVGSALLFSRHRGAFETAWFLTGLLAVLNALALLTIGIAAVPATAALIVACALWGGHGKRLDGAERSFQPNSTE